MKQKNDEDLITYYRDPKALYSDFNKRFEGILLDQMDIS